MNLLYRNTRADAIAQYYLQNPNVVQDTWANYLGEVALKAFILGLGIHVSLAASKPLAACIFVVALIYSIVPLIGFRRKLHRSIETMYASTPEHDIQLEIEETGLTETVRGIKSIVPWQAVTSYQVNNGRLYVKLATGQCALIPEREIRQGAEHYQDLIAEIKRRRIKNDGLPIDG